MLFPNQVSLNMWDDAGERPRVNLPKWFPVLLDTKTPLLSAVPLCGSVLGCGVFVRIYFTCRVLFSIENRISINYESYKNSVERQPGFLLWANYSQRNRRVSISSTYVFDE